MSVVASVWEVCGLSMNFRLFPVERLLARSASSSGAYSKTNLRGFSQGGVLAIFTFSFCKMLTWKK